MRVLRWGVLFGLPKVELLCGKRLCRPLTVCDAPAAPPTSPPSPLHLPFAFSSPSMRQVGDATFWASHDASLGCEGQNGQASEMMGIVSFQYHANGWDTLLWGRIVAGSSLGFDLDMYCQNPGGKCTWEAIADSYYLEARLYQLALTDELYGVTHPDSALTAAAGGVHYRFAGGGQVMAAHVLSLSGGAAAVARSRAGAPMIGPPSTWPFGGDSIPVSTGLSVLVPLVLPNGTLAPDTLHAYVASGTAPPDPNCPLFQTAYLGANNTAVGNWASPPLASFELDPSVPEVEAVAACNASCWGNTTCGAWDLIKVTPFSGKVKPLCMLFSEAVGCSEDPNQWAGSKNQVPYPTTGTVNSTWTLPLSWVGLSLHTTTLTPEGPQEGVPAVVVTGRSFTLVDVSPGLPVRITVQL